MHISKAREQKPDYGMGVSWGERECRQGAKTDRKNTGLAVKDTGWELKVDEVLTEKH